MNNYQGAKAPRKPVFVHLAPREARALETAWLFFSWRLGVLAVVFIFFHFASFAFSAPLRQVFQPHLLTRS
ncbi:MAG TPA: hypothetical protein ENK12_04060 [Gammaproteobacteria bacterium]|nr:hypothetical protein [Gammaproteobacteria bacterium]